MHGKIEIAGLQVQTSSEKMELALHKTTGQADQWTESIPVEMTRLCVGNSAPVAWPVRLPDAMQVYDVWPCWTSGQGLQSQWIIHGQVDPSGISGQFSMSSVHLRGYLTVHLVYWLHPGDQRRDLLGNGQRKVWIVKRGMDTVHWPGWPLVTWTIGVGDPWVNRPWERKVSHSGDCRDWCNHCVSWVACPSISLPCFIGSKSWLTNPPLSPDIWHFLVSDYRIH